MIHTFIPAAAEPDRSEERQSLAASAAEHLCSVIAQQVWYPQLFETAGGKMFGVLAVKEDAGYAYLAAFSGMLAGRWEQPGFVPPLFDAVDWAPKLAEGNNRITQLSRQIEQLEHSDNRKQLQATLGQLLTDQEQALTILRNQMRERKELRRIKREQGGPCISALNQQSQSDGREWKQLKKRWEQSVNAITESLLQIDDDIEVLKKTRASYSYALQKQLFDDYELLNSTGEARPMAELFSPDLPPGGTGDCAAPKLVQYANQHGLKPVALTEFWVGSPPPGGVRHHGQHYAPCRSKCAHILPFMLEDVKTVVERRVFTTDRKISVIYEDQSLLVVIKPEGLLSTPGKSERDSVFTRIRAEYPDVSGPLLVHRLDMDTSGIMLLAKDKKSHKNLQRQFLQRQVEKEYNAMVVGRPLRQNGLISLPLRVDLDDRPRQMVCDDHGRPAQTHYEVTECKEGLSRVTFQPITGRTHQLRVHAAHVSGLNSPIVGDPLYGVSSRSGTHSGRMMLHAHKLTFRHPDSGERLTFAAPIPF